MTNVTPPIPTWRDARHVDDVNATSAGIEMPDNRVIKLSKAEVWLNERQGQLNVPAGVSPKRAALRTFLVLLSAGESWPEKLGPIETSLAAVAFERGKTISAGARWPDLLASLLLPGESRQRRSVLSRALCNVVYKNWSPEEVVSVGLENAATGQPKPKGKLWHGAHPLTAQCLTALRTGAQCRHQQGIVPTGQRQPR